MACGCNDSSTTTTNPCSTGCLKLIDARCVVTKEALEFCTLTIPAGTDILSLLSQVSDTLCSSMGEAWTTYDYKCLDDSAPITNQKEFAETVAKAICDLKTIVGTGIDETWKTIGAGGLMANAQAVPGYTPGNFSSGTVYSPSLQIRKTKDGKLAIRGHFKQIAPVALVVFTLPVGYTLFPTPAPTSYSIVGVNTTALTPALFRIASLGNTLYCETPGAENDEFFIPETILSLD